MRIILCILLGFVLACNNDTETTVTQSDTTTTSNPPPGSGPVTENPAPTTTPSEECYRQVIGRDTLTVSIQQSGNMVTGRMRFDNYQKDGSSGTIKGEVAADTIKVWYDFQSEGMNSVMEIYLKKDNGKLIRGVGPMGVKGDTAYYTNKSAIKYEGAKYEKVDCSQLD